MDKNAYILFYKKTARDLTKSEFFNPVGMKENPSTITEQQVPENQILAGSRVYMNDKQFDDAVTIRRAPTTHPISPSPAH
jgi:hypothetical protein